MLRPIWLASGVGFLLTPPCIVGAAFKPSEPCGAFAVRVHLNSTVSRLIVPNKGCVRPGCRERPFRTDPDLRILILDWPLVRSFCASLLGNAESSTFPRYTPKLLEKPQPSTQRPEKKRGLSFLYDPATAVAEGNCSKAQR